METSETPMLKVQERVVVKKFDGDWTAEQMESGEADEALVEAITIEDDVVIDHWKIDGSDERRS